MGLIDYFQNFFKNSSNPFIAKESLGNLKKKLKERFDIPSHNIWVINDYSKNHRTGYVEIPKKDDVCQASIEEIVSKFYSDSGFEIKERIGDYSMRFSNRKKTLGYNVKILSHERSYCIDVDFGNIQKL